jgi:hypothetical protein
MTSTTTLYGGAAHRRVTILDLKKAKTGGEKWAMLTSYEQMTAEISIRQAYLFYWSAIAPATIFWVKRTPSQSPSMK